MRLALKKLISAMLNPKMFFVTQVKKAVVATPVIGMDNAIRTHTAPDNRLKGLASTVRNNFRVDFTISLEMPNTMVLPPAPRPLRPLNR